MYSDNIRNLLTIETSIKYLRFNGNLQDGYKK